MTHQLSKTAALSFLTEWTARQVTKKAAEQSASCDHVESTITSQNSQPVSNTSVDHRLQAVAELLVSVQTRRKPTTPAVETAVRPRRSKAA